jgi:hypothetical protein
VTAKEKKDEQDEKRKNPEDIKTFKIFYYNG